MIHTVKHPRCLNNTEREEQQISIPGSNSVDSNQYNNIEMKYACLQVYSTSYSRSPTDIGLARTYFFGVSVPCSLTKTKVP